MKIEGVIFTLALSSASVNANWFGSKSSSIEEWNTDQLQNWLKENKIKFSDKSNKDILLKTVKKNWDTVAHRQQVILNDIKDETIDKWDESKIREYLLENGVVAPKSSVEELRILVKQLAGDVRSSASSAAAEATAHASSTYDASKDNAKDRLTYIHDYILHELNDSRDFIYSSWNDNELRSFLEKKGIIRTKSQIKRDDLLKSMRQYYATLADPVYDAWSDNYIRHWLESNGVIKTKSAKTRDELLGLMKDNYYDAKSHVYNTWSDNQLRTWLVDRGYLKSRDEKTRDEMLYLVEKYYTSSRDVVVSSWRTSDLRDWAISHGLIKSDVQVKREELEKLAHAKYDKLTSTAAPYVSWTDARLRGWLRAYEPEVAKAAKTRDELLSEVRKRYVDSIGYGEVVYGEIMGWVNYGRSSIGCLYNYLTGSARSVAENAQEKADELGKSADIASKSAEAAASSASSLAAKASKAAKKEL